MVHQQHTNVPIILLMIAHKNVDKVEGFFVGIFDQMI